MKNLFSKFVEVWIVGLDGVPKKAIPHLGGQPIPWVDNGVVVQRLSITTPTSFSLATLKAGVPITITPAAYSGTGPIDYLGQLRLNGEIVVERNNQDPFTITLEEAGEIVWTGQASGLHPSDPPVEEIKRVVLAPDIPDPVFSRPPSITPSEGDIGETFQIDPGAGTGLSWKLFLDATEVTSSVSDLAYTPDRAGQLSLTSLLYDRGKTATVTVTVTVKAIPLPDWDVQGGQSLINFNRMPVPMGLLISGGSETLTFEEV